LFTVLLGGCRLRKRERMRQGDREAAAGSI
jgi:hypothetical protein